MKRGAILSVVLAVILTGCAENVITHRLMTSEVRQYTKAEFAIQLDETFQNPYDQNEVRLDMVLNTPSGKELVLPCFFDGDSKQWRARFTPVETGTYQYKFTLTKAGDEVSQSKGAQFQSKRGEGDGFLHVNDYWTLKFDSGKPFRGIGENVGWESRSFEDEKWTYDYLLPSLSRNGANFFRTWMCVWNLPVAFPNVNDTKRYTNSEQYFHEGGIRRMDELVEMCDSLGLYFMLAFDAHGSLMPDGYWKYNSHNVVNGGPASTPTEFFTVDASKEKYKNRLRYIVARWGYSPAIAAWEFFNEIDNAVFTPTPHDSVLIDHKIIAEWHDEMSTYLKSIDPYDHIVTTSVSHREIDGMNDLPNIDLNQMHIYNKTHMIAPTIHRYTQRHNKPYVIGEFGYDWNWDNVTHDRGEGFDFDYKRGLWYGLFSPTPIIPMTWWWEFFDERNMTPYFNSVREISDRMLAAGNGSFERMNIASGSLEGYAVKCGETAFVYLLNNSERAASAVVELDDVADGMHAVEYYDPGKRDYVEKKDIEFQSGRVGTITMEPGRELVLVISAGAETVTGSK